MTYRLDDEGAFDRCRVGAGNEAVGATDRAGQWCAHELTDGVFPRDIAVSIAQQKVWDRALLHKLIEELPSGEYRILTYLQWNWPADKVTAQRERDRKRKSTQRHSVCPTGTPHVTPVGHPPGVAAGVTAVGQGEASALRSESDPEGVQGEPVSEVKLKSVPPVANDTPDRSPEHIAIALQIRTHALFRTLDAHRIADHHCGWMLATGKKLEWAIQGINECAAKSDGLGMSSEALQAKLVGFMRSAKGPKRDEREVKGGPAYKTFPTEPEQAFTPEQAKANVDRASGILATLTRKAGGT